MIEREVRYKIDERIRDKVINSTCPLENKTKCVDLCMGKYGFDSLDKLGYIIRLREKNGKVVMESKKRLEDNTWSEAKISLESMKQGYDFLLNIGLKPYLYINRTREVREIDIAKVFIDDLELLGSFVEFEMKDGYTFEDLENYLNEVGIENKPEKLYGDIFKDKIKEPEFSDKLNKAINDFLNQK